MRRRWRFLVCGPGAGAWHMALDEALAELCGQGASPPTLRAFVFEGRCLSLGRLQPASPLAQRAEALGIGTVRRPTGGGAVLHAGDICYAVVAPLDDPAVGGPLRRSYCQMALALARALESLGVTSPRVCEATARAARAEACFASSSAFEVTAGGAKLVGSAQLRRRGALLQQGSLRTVADHALEVSLFGSSLGPSLAELLGRVPSLAEVAEALRRGFAEVLGLELEPGSLLPHEEALARARLAAAA